GGMGVLGRPEDLVFVVLEGLDPRGDVGSMLLWIVGNTFLRGEEHAGQFRSKLLLRVVGVAEAVAFVEGLAVEPHWMAAPMRQFMERRAVVVRRIPERFPCREVDLVGSRTVEGPVILIVRDACSR